MNQPIVFAEIIDRIDTYEKYLKVIQVLTQGLWYAVTEVRLGHYVPTADGLYAFLAEVLRRGELSSYDLPEIEKWWSKEVLNAYNEVRADNGDG